MKNNFVITISRQFGSGGREIGRLAAEALGIKYYDNELITIAAKESGIAPELFENAEKTASNSLLYSLAMGTYSMVGGVPSMLEMPLNDRLFLIQSDVIKRLAQESPCVIIGRCADYVLRDNPNCLNVFIHADLENRIKRATSSYNLPLAKCDDVIQKTDKKRATYYNYYTSRKWGRSENYDLCINSSCLGVAKSAEVIVDFAKIKQTQLV